MKYALAFLAALPVALAQSPIYGQCGGQGWSGPTTCATGSVCTYSNPYYSQCLPGTASSTSTKPVSSSSSSASSTTTVKSTSTTSTSTSTASGPTNAVCGNRALTHFKFTGVSESGAEFGTTAIPGTLGKDYTWPSPSSIDYFVGKGFNTFRIPFLMERLTPSGITGSFNSAYLSGLTTIVNYVTGKGAYALIDPHNYMRFNNQIINSTSDFGTFWVNLSNQFKSNSRVIFDLQNEPNGIDASVVFNLMQAAVNAIRQAGATNMIFVEGTSWTGAWTWTSAGNAAAFTGLKDPQNNIAIEMHQYLDSDGSGTSDQCVNSTIGSSRVADATNWLKTNNFKGVLGEFGGGSNSVCATAIQGMLCDMQASGVWLGALWWAAGPWWGTYFQSMEPPSGAAIPTILPAILAAEA